MRRRDCTCNSDVPSNRALMVSTLMLSTSSIGGLFPYCQNESWRDQEVKTVQKSQEGSKKTSKAALPRRQLPSTPGRDHGMGRSFPFWCWTWSCPSEICTSSRASPTTLRYNTALNDRQAIDVNTSAFGQLQCCRFIFLVSSKAGTMHPM